MNLIRLLSSPAIYLVKKRIKCNYIINNFVKGALEGPFLRLVVLVTNVNTMSEAEYSYFSNIFGLSFFVNVPSRSDDVCSLEKFTFSPGLLVSFPVPTMCQLNLSAMI